MEDTSEQQGSEQGTSFADAAAASAANAESSFATAFRVSRRYERGFPVPVEDHERVALALTAIRLRADAELKRGERKDIGAEIAELDERAAEIDKQVLTGERQEPAAVEERIFFEQNVVRVVLVETGAVVEERALTADEREREMEIARQTRQLTLDDAMAEQVADDTGAAPCVGCGAMLRVNATCATCASAANADAPRCGATANDGAICIRDAGHRGDHADGMGPHDGQWHNDDDDDDDEPRDSAVDRKVAAAAAAVQATSKKLRGKNGK